MPRRAPDVTRDQLRQAAQQVATALGARLVILFGSAARGASPEDLDLGVLGDSVVDAVDATNRFIRALGLQAVDVADLRRADPLLLMLAARDGISLYERSPGEFARFASLAARRYADTRKFRDAERLELRDFIARSGTVR